MTYSDYFPLRFINTSGETAPAFCVLQVDGWQEENDLGFFKCKKPDDEGEIYILNGTRPVPAGGVGRATSALNRMGAFALFDDTNTPEINQPWGPQPDEWHLKKDGEGFFIIGDVKGNPASQPGFPVQASTKRVRVSGVAGGGGGGATAGWGKVVAHSGSDRITAADPLADPPLVGWGYINPCSCPSLPDDINEEPDDPADLDFSVDEDTFLVVYNIVPAEIVPGIDTDVYVQWKTLGPSGHRFVDVESCTPAEA